MKRHISKEECEGAILHSPAFLCGEHVSPQDNVEGYLH